jgi:hypothetical protein
MAKFAAIPALPATGVPYWEQQTLTALKTNIELLLGVLNKDDPASQVVLKQNFILTEPGVEQITALTSVSVGAIGHNVQLGYDIIRMDIGSWPIIPPTLATCGYFEDLQKMSFDVANIRAAVEAITRKLQGN